MYTYPESYKAKPLDKQENILRKYFRELPEVLEALPEDTSEGLFLIPKWQLIAPAYGEALKRVLKAIESERPFYNYRSGKLGKEYLRESDRKIAAFKDMPHMMVISAQFGQGHAGESVKSVREGYKPNEIGFGAYEVAIMLLTHPERLKHYDDLWIDCPGDEYADGDFSHAPYFNFHDGQVKFGTSGVSYAYDNYGSASGFAPQAILESRNLGSLDSSSALKLISEMEETLGKLKEYVDKLGKA